MNSIPYYYDVYRHPHGCRPGHDHFPDNQATSQAIQTSKDVDIVDPYGNVRYIVQLSSTTVDNKLGFQTKVSQTTKDGPVLFLTIPENGYDLDYKRAMESFETCVQRYSSLVNAETKDFNNIEIYKDRIDYRVQKPDCCANCRWCRGCHRHHDHDGYAEFPHHLECHNPKNQEVFNYSKAFPPFPNKDVHRYCRNLDTWKKLPWQQHVPDYGDPRYYRDCQHPGDQALSPIFPTVDIFGICENFEKIQEDKDNKH